jgi:hypothetical protein
MTKAMTPDQKDAMRRARLQGRALDAIITLIGPEPDPRRRALDQSLCMRHPEAVLDAIKAMDKATAPTP